MAVLLAWRQKYARRMALSSRGTTELTVAIAADKSGKGSFLISGRAI
jgi:hypothetical protein